MPYQLARAALGYGGRFVWTRPWGDQRLRPFARGGAGWAYRGGQRPSCPPACPSLRWCSARLGCGRSTGCHGGTGTRDRPASRLIQRLSPTPFPADIARTGGADALAERIAIAADRQRSPKVPVIWSACTRVTTFSTSRASRPGTVVRPMTSWRKARLAQQLGQPAQLWDLTVNTAQLALLEGRFEEAEAAVHAALEPGRSAQSANAQVGFELERMRFAASWAGWTNRLTPSSALSTSTPPIRSGGTSAPTCSRSCAEGTRHRRPSTNSPRRASRSRRDAVALQPRPAHRRMQIPRGRRSRRDALLVATPVCRTGCVHDPGNQTGDRHPEASACLRRAWQIGRPAAEHFEEALDINQRIRARPWVAHTQDDFARMLVERDGPGDPERAEQLLDEAIRNISRAGYAELRGSRDGSQGATLAT